MGRRTKIAAALTAGIAAIGALAIGWAGPLQNNPWVVRWLGPPTKELHEAYAGTGAGGTFDHAVLDGLLARHVRGHGVDYAGLAGEADALDRYLEALATAPFDALDRDGKLALLINAYNAFTLKLILDHRPLASIKDIPAAERWDAERWTVGGRRFSLTALEHDELRAKFVEPRIHFAINCASVGCPPLRGEAYVPGKLEGQLEDQSRIIHTDPHWLRIEGRTVHLTPLYLWYGGDFTQVAGSPLAYAARYRPELGEGDWSVVYTDYDWSLNTGLKRP